MSAEPNIVLVDGPAEIERLLEATIAGPPASLRIPTQAPKTVEVPKTVEEPEAVEERYEERYQLRRSLGVDTNSGEFELDLEGFDRDDEFARRVSELLGFGAPVGSAFACVLPGHEATPGTAKLWCDERGVYVYRCLARHRGRGSYALMQVYAALVAGRERDRGGPELAIWKRRLLADVGVVELSPVELRALPDDAPGVAQRVRLGVQRLVAVRLLGGDTGPFPLSRAFLADWCDDVSEGDVRHALPLLVSAGVVAKVGTLPARGGHRPAYLYAAALEPARNESPARGNGEAGP